VIDETGAAKTRPNSSTGSRGGLGREREEVEKINRARTDIEIVAALFVSGTDLYEMLFGVKSE
jgi:hypothetical protein